MKVRLVKSLAFPGVMYGCECWTIKKAERRRIDAFELWCWRRLLSPLDCKEIQRVHPEGNQSWIIIRSTDCWSWNANPLATWCKELTHWKRPWCWGRLRAGGEGGNRGWDGRMESWTQWTWAWASSGCWRWTGKPCVLQFMGLQRVRLSNWIELNCSVNRRRQWHPTPVLLPGESHGRRSLVGCSPRGCKESDTTE